ncbi:hypothetical protein D3C71_1501530 [compost metagenome]
MQADDGNALATLVKHGRERSLVVVEASVLAAVDKLPLPRAAREQRGPHLLVGLRRGLATGHH